MTTLFRWFSAIGMFLLGTWCGCAAPGESFPGLGRAWRYYQSPNFELYSANNDRDSRDALEKMELLRAVFLETFRLKVRLPQPVTLFYFDRQEDFATYLPASHRGGDAEYLGFCSSFPDRTIITIAPARSRESATRVVYHEYIHYLFQITEQRPAPWFNEGYAELFSTLEINKEWLEFGQPIVRHLLELKGKRMMPFQALFSVGYESPLFKSADETELFYAQSWAFLHFCQFGDSKFPPEIMNDFLGQAGSSAMREHPEQMLAACRDLLGLDDAGVRQAMTKYLAHGSFRGARVKRPTITAKQAYAVRSVAQDEIKLRLAELAVRMTGNPYAHLFIREQVDKTPETRLHELLGTLGLQADEKTVALDHWRLAVQGGTTNAAIYRELGRMESNQVFDQFDLDYQMPENRAEALRHLLIGSLNCAPDQSEGYEMLAWVEAMAAAPVIANINQIQRHFPTLNDRARTLLALSIVRMRMGKPDEALQMLQQVGSLNPSPETLWCVELTRARLEKRPADRSLYPQVPTSGLRLTRPTYQLPH